jgi:hypothetical protein
MNMKEVKKTQERLREERIKVLGGFGNKVEQVVPDVTKYTRKTKHKKS